MRGYNMERKRKMGNTHWITPWVTGYFITALAYIFLVLHLLDWYHLNEVTFMCIALIALGLITHSMGTIVGVLKKKMYDDE